MTPDQILGALGLLLSTAQTPVFETLAAGGYDPRYPVTVNACPDSTAPLDVEGQTVVCGTVSVPESYDAPDGRRVPLEFVLAKSRSTQPFDDAIVYLHGGPAGGALKSIAAVTEVVLGGHRAHRDVVSFDQRAAMLSSSTVRCYGAIAENIVGLIRSAEDLPTPEGETPFDLTTIYRPCVEEIYASGADLPEYNTANNARDVRAVMSALGYPTYNILGISYGTRLALEVLRTAPEGVRSVIIDGVAPPTVKLYDDLLPPHADAMEALFDQCAADAGCAAAYPDLRAKFTALGETLAETPIPAARGRPEVTPDLFYGMVSLRTRYDQAWVRELSGYLPRMIYELAEGDSTTFDWYMDTFADSDDADTSELPGDAAPLLVGDEEALARTILESAQAMSDQTEAVAAALNRLKHDVAVGSGAVSVAETFDLRAGDALKNLPHPQAVAAIRDYVAFQTEPPSRQTVAAWVEAHFDGRDRAALTGLVNAMTPADISRTFQIASIDLAPYQEAVESTMGLYIYACQEDFPYNSRAGAEQTNAAFPYSLILTDQVREKIGQLYDDCALFEPAPREGFHEPVVSDVPVLSVGGTNDTQTSWKWSALAAETLSNARVVILPNSGHGASLYSDCGRDMNVKFILDPAAELDLSCVDELLPQFALPDDPLD